MADFGQNLWRVAQTAGEGMALAQTSVLRVGLLALLF